MSDSITRSLSDSLHTIARQTMSRHSLPGLVAGLVMDGRLAWIHSSGVSDLGSGQQPDENTVFRCASITKTFTSTALLQLRDQGKLSLDDPLVIHLPEFAAAQPDAGLIEEVTLQRMLCHRSGLVSEAPLDYWETGNWPDTAALLASLSGVRVVIPQDSAFKYSNLAFALLGEVVARVSGTPYTDYVEQNILAPLDMRSTGFQLSEDMRGRFTPGYDPVPYQDYPEQADHQSLAGISAAGQIYSCAADLARWLAFHMAPEEHGEGILAARSVEEMQRIRYTDGEMRNGWATPWMASRHGERVYLGHGGGLPGHRTAIFFSARHGVGSIVLTNLGWQSAPEELGPAILDRAIAELGDAHADDKQKPLSPPPGDWRPLLGLYRGFVDLKIEYVTGKLRLASPEGARSLHAPAELEATDDPDVFMARGGRASGEPLIFHREASGRVAFFRVGGFRYDRLDGPEG
ncbi:MAG: serine hydrolase domain-containing protein [Chloroflexota bacterium]